MKGGRKNLKRAAGEETFTLQQGQSIVQVVSLRGSNLIEVTFAQTLASLTSSFRFPSRVGLLFGILVLHILRFFVVASQSTSYTLQF